jgi:hypothetical protein
VKISGMLTLVSIASLALDRAHQYGVYKSDMHQIVLDFSHNTLIVTGSNVLTKPLKKILSTIPRNFQEFRLEGSCGIVTDEWAIAIPSISQDHVSDNKWSFRRNISHISGLYGEVIGRKMGSDAKIVARYDRKLGVYAISIFPDRDISHVEKFRLTEGIGILKTCIDNQR